MQHQVKRILIAAGVLVALVGVALPWFVYGSRPDVAFKRAWNRLAAAMSRPGSGGIVLPMTFDAQDHSLSCEVAALKMALASRGVRVSESELIDLVGFDPTPKRQETGRIIWGDPQEGYVGDIDGRMPTTGYGVYWRPIERAAREWRAARAVEGMTPKELAQELAVGNPVVLWAYLGSGESYEWQTPAGDSVQAVLLEHTFTAYGFVGSVNDPEGFYLMDPIYGPRYWSTDELFDRMRPLGYGAVIIY